MIRNKGIFFVILTTIWNFLENQQLFFFIFVSEIRFCFDPILKMLLQVRLKF